jgi:phosphopantothenoylcysteine decarboxylase
MNILLGVTGSVAAKLTPKLQKALFDSGFNFKTVYTEAAKHFTKNNLSQINEFYDEHEWQYYEDNNQVLHIDLVKWADVLVVAPCTANTLSKIANGLCDNLLTCCVRAWGVKKHLVIAPAMNTQMFTHPVMREHAQTVVGRGAVWIPPQTKELFCGDTGIGAMAEIDDIIKKLKQIV